MKHLILMILACFIVGCASTPQKADLFVKYPLEGEIVWMYTAGSTNQDPQFIIDYESFQEFIIWMEKERVSQK